MAYKTAWAHSSAARPCSSRSCSRALTPAPPAAHRCRSPCSARPLMVPPTGAGHRKALMTDPRALPPTSGTRLPPPWPQEPRLRAALRTPHQGTPPGAPLQGQPETQGPRSMAHVAAACDALVQPTAPRRPPLAFASSTEPPVQMCARCGCCLWAPTASQARLRLNPGVGPCSMFQMLLEALGNGALSSSCSSPNQVLQDWAGTSILASPAQRATGW